MTEVDKIRERLSGWISRIIKKSSVEEYGLESLDGLLIKGIEQHLDRLIAAVQQQTYEAVRPEEVKMLDRLPVYYRPIQTNGNGDYGKRDETADVIEMYSKKQVDSCLAELDKRYQEINKTK